MFKPPSAIGLEMCAFVAPTWLTIELQTKLHRIYQQDQVAKDIFAMPWLH